MRLPPIPPDRLTPEQRALYDRSREQIAHGFTSFRTAREARCSGPGGCFCTSRRSARPELVLWIGAYAQVAITLNVFDVPSEEVFDR